MIKRKPVTTLGWFMLSLIPILNMYWYWRVSKILAGCKENKKELIK